MKEDEASHSPLQFSGTEHRYPKSSKRVRDQDAGARAHSTHRAGGWMRCNGSHKGTSSSNQSTGKGHRGRGGHKKGHHDARRCEFTFRIMHTCVGLLLVVVAACAGEELSSVEVALVHNGTDHGAHLLEPPEPWPWPVNVSLVELPQASADCSGGPRLVVVSPLQDGVYDMGQVALQCDIDCCGPKSDFFIVVKSQGVYLATIAPGVLVRRRLAAVQTLDPSLGVAAHCATQGDGSHVVHGARVCMCMCACVRESCASCLCAWCCRAGSPLTLGVPTSFSSSCCATTMSLALRLGRCWTNCWCVKLSR
jgi:hypothetical protein